MNTNLHEEGVVGKLPTDEPDDELPPVALAQEASSALAATAPPPAPSHLNVSRRDTLRA
ncbi:MAG TPA: hypothetical protein VG756_03590 [Pseudonocardiaceae bacterium]|nr:hypothetical protein [Pseudonocardiaceae bacterium]